MVGPHITAAAAEAAVTELCYENRCTREILDEENLLEETGSSPQSSDQDRFTSTLLIYTYIYTVIFPFQYWYYNENFSSFRDLQPESLDGQTQPTKPGTSICRILRSPFL